jgi:hypothetical protein
MYEPNRFMHEQSPFMHECCTKNAKAEKIFLWFVGFKYQMFVFVIEERND